MIGLLLVLGLSYVSYKLGHLYGRASMVHLFVSASDIIPPKDLIAYFKKLGEK